MFEPERLALDRAFSAAASGGGLADAWARCQSLVGLRDDGDDAALDAVAGEMAALSLPDLARVIRLVTARFHLLNKAEQLNIVRVNRERELAGGFALACDG